MRGAALTRDQSHIMHLSDAQRLAVDWYEDSGPEPG